MKKVAKGSGYRLTVLFVVVFTLAQVLGCGSVARPVAAVLYQVVVCVGQRATEFAVQQGLSMVFQRIFGDAGGEPALRVTPEVGNNLRGTCKGPVEVKNKQDASKTFLLVDFPVVRSAVGARWEVDPTYLQRVESIVK